VFFNAYAYGRLFKDSQHQINSIGATCDDHKQLLAEQVINE
jgi:hypothetical protein